MDDTKDVSSMLDTSFSFYIVEQNLLHATSTFKRGWETYLHTEAIYFAKIRLLLLDNQKKRKNNKKKNYQGRQGRMQVFLTQHTFPILQENLIILPHSSLIILFIYFILPKIDNLQVLNCPVHTTQMWLLTVQKCFLKCTNQKIKVNVKNNQ